MRTFVNNIIPKIQLFSKKLDDLTLLTNQHWVVFDDDSLTKVVYIFRSNNQLLVSRNGKVDKGEWENIGNSSIIIDFGKESFLFKHGFFDENILALKVDGKNEYAFLVNENIYSSELNSYDKINEILERYLPLKPSLEIVQSADSRSIVNLEPILSDKGMIYLEGSKYDVSNKKVFANENRGQLFDGKYKIGFMWYIHVRNGIIIRVSLI